MPKCAKSSKQKPKPRAVGNHPQKGKLGDMGDDPRYYNKPVMNRSSVNIAVAMALAGNAMLAK